MQIKLLNTIKHYDIGIFCWCMELQIRPLLARASRLVSHTGDGYYYGLILLAMYVYGAAVPVAFYMAAGLAVAGERLCYYILKLGLRRDRPASAIGGFESFIQPADQFSFPSGHTSAAFLFATLLTPVVPAAAPFLIGWAVAVGLSRLFLGVHFLTDILVGATIGVVIGQAALANLI